MEWPTSTTFSRLHRVHHLQHVLREPRRVEAEVGLARVASATTRHRDHAMLLREQRREFVEAVRSGAEAGQQQDGRARAAEIQHLELHAFIDGDGMHFVWRGIAPARCLKALALRRRATGRSSQVGAENAGQSSATSGSSPPRPTR